LIDAIAASCFIPLYGAPFQGTVFISGAKPGTGSRMSGGTAGVGGGGAAAAAAEGVTIEDSDERGEEHHRYIDGGVYAFIPPVGEVTLSPFSDDHFPIKPLNFRSIDIHLNKQDYSLAKLLVWALKPPGESELRQLYYQGFDRASAWADEQKKNEW
jgi:hypothetical protein